MCNVVPHGNIRLATLISIFSLASMASASTTLGSGSGPAKPPTLHPENAYVHITSAASPSALQAAINAQPGLGSSLTGEETGTGLSAAYVGPVGELKDEHIFAITVAQGATVKRAESVWQKESDSVLSAIRRVEGVKGVNVLEMRQRAKRDEF
jgi:hypothetical protein